MKTKYILSGAVLSLLAVSCTDLDVDIKSTYTEFPESEIAFDSKTADAYYAFRGALGRRFDEGNSCNSDEYTAVSFGGDYLNSRDMANFSLHTINPSSSDAQLAVFQDLTSGITKCNKLIYFDLADLGGEDSQLAGPLRAVRAFYTFVLMDHWGDVPILDHMVAEDEVVNRAPRADVAKWIESELLAVRDKCATNVDASTYGKPTRWMVDALLAKLYINWPVYTSDVTSSSWTYGSNPKLADCIAACDDVINSGKFNLNDDYVTKFMYNNGPQIKDFIYAMPFDGPSKNGLTYGRFRTWRQANKANRMYTPNMSNSCGGNMALTPEFAALFNLPGDRRNDVILGGDIYLIDGATGEKTSQRAQTTAGEPLHFTQTITLVTMDGDLDCGKNDNGWQQGYKSMKFQVYVPEYNTYSRNQSNDVPIFRFADILLMKAEAIVRGGAATNGDTALSLFNQIRSYVKAPTLEDTPTLQDIEDERGREFLDEHWRRNDLIRMGHFERKWGFKEEFGSSDPKMRLWPLGQSTLNSNSHWSQNAGY